MVTEHESSTSATKPSIINQLEHPPKEIAMTSTSTRLQCAAATVTAAVALLGLSACGGGSAGGSGEAKTLNVLTWETYHDKAALDAFTKATGIRVNAVNVGSADEAYAKVKSAPTQWDLVLVTAGWFDNYAKANLLEPIDESKVTALKDIKLGFDWRGAASSGGKLYGVLYNWGNQPLAWSGSIPAGVDRKYLNAQGQPVDWNILWDPAFKGKVSVFDDPTSVLPMIPLALGMKDPYHLTDAQFAQMKDKLMALRPQLKRLTSGFNDQTDQFASGEATLGYLNNIASVPALKKAGKTLNVNNIVDQGVPAWSDNYSITAQGGAKKLDSVYKFINYTETLPWQAAFVKSSGNNGTLDYAQATSAEAQKAGLSKDVLDGTLIPSTKQGDAFFSKMLFFQPVEDQAKRVDLWNQFKLGIGQ
jgi:spermidine/putrescine-binding protein